MRPVVTEVAGGVFHVEGPGTNWQLLVEDGDVVLVDTGWPRDYELVVRSLAEVGKGPHDVVAILLTHAHRDHLGTAAAFRHRHGTPIWCHRNEAPHARGEVVEEISKVALAARLWRPTVMLFAANIIWRGATRVERLDAVETFDQDTALDLPGAPVPIPTPGHTSGHCSFHLPSQGALLTGDALVTYDLLRRRPIVGPMPRVFDHDPDQSVESLRRLSKLDAHVVLPGHGTPYHGTPADAITNAREARSPS